MQPNLGQYKNEILHRIYSGEITAHSLPRKLYEAIADYLLDGLVKGYKQGKMKQGKLNDKIVRNDWVDPLKKYMFDSADETMINQLMTNTYMFTASKIFNETMDMRKLLVDDNGLVRSFKEFETEAGGVWDTYNETWLKTEFDTAVAGSRSASKWVEIQKNKVDRPYLRYSAVMDDHTCEICASLDDITLPIDDPFWLENIAPNHFNCECVTEQLDEDDLKDVDGLSDEEEVSAAVERSQAHKDEAWNFNPGIKGEIFPTEGSSKHPYFDVPKEYLPLAKRNFNLPLPDSIQYDKETEE
jgi:SPP1 gp7 family putative phage head morphogenesis protein